MHAGAGAKAQEDAANEKKTEGSPPFAEMCRQMMAGAMPNCCGTQMKDMMSHWMSVFWTKEEKQARDVGETEAGSHED